MAKIWIIAGSDWNNSTYIHPIAFRTEAEARKLCGPARVLLDRNGNNLLQDSVSREFEKKIQEIEGFDGLSLTLAAVEIQD